MHFNQVLLGIQFIIGSGYRFFIYPEIVCSGTHERNSVKREAVPFILGFSDTFEENLVACLTFSD